ncbi:YkgJ family cysteine cluster protein [Azospirillum sp.]|uniref:YkgJ family cysteine cluster protein n=1 Tax=Azospirillum sp. TaxID=34012 RepID=UPI002D5E912A|nr:YkgJ family cysteine cluster protein [Azospirillum sp.]HYD70430.1 YkgJ family cysteine cluster protein [Azospirillum sp.]
MRADPVALTRQQRRQQERDDERLLRHGIPLNEDAAPLLAEARRLLRILARGEATRAGDAAAAIHAGFDTALRWAKPEPAACRRGCAHCCVSYVAVTAPELFLIARSLKGPRRAAVAARVAEADAVTHGRTLAERFAEPRFCPLLEDGACGVYAVRPSSCRSLASFDAEACARAFGANSGEGLPGPAAGLELRSAYQASLRAALTLAGLPAAAYELNAGLNRVLQTPDAEARWLAGEDVFAGIPAEGGAKPNFDATVRFLVQEIRAENG